MKGVDLFRPCINKLRCLLELDDKLGDAKSACIEVIKLIKSTKFNSDLKESYSNIDDDLLDLLMNSSRLRLKCPNAVLPLSEELTKIIKIFYTEDDSGTALKKLSVLGSSLISWTPKDTHIVSTKMNFLKKLLEEMQNLDVSSLKEKSLIVALFLRDLGKCYRNLNEDALSVTNFQQAINLIRTIGGKNSERWKALGMCYYELGVTFQQCLKFDEAREAFFHAKAIIESSTDITENEIQVYLNRIEQKMTYQNFIQVKVSLKTKCCCCWKIFAIAVLVIIVSFVLYFLISNCVCVEYMKEEASLSCNGNSVEQPQLLTKENDFKTNKEKHESSDHQHSANEITISAYLQNLVKNSYSIITAVITWYWYYS